MTDVAGQSNRSVGPRRLLVGSVTVVAVAALLLVSGAAPGATSSSVPSCVNLHQWEDRAEDWWNPLELGWNKARATNMCSTPLRIELEWSWVNDTSCHVLAPGRSLFSERHSQMRAEVTGIQSC